MVTPFPSLPSVKTRKQTGFKKKKNKPTTPANQQHGMWQIHLQCHLLQVPALITFFICKVNTAKRLGSSRGREDKHHQRSAFPTEGLARHKMPQAAGLPHSPRDAAIAEQTSLPEGPSLLQEGNCLLSHLFHIHITAY